MEGALAGFVASLVAATGTALGAMILLVRRTWSPLQQTLMLATSAGIMLGATVFSLTLPALESLRGMLGDLGGTGWVAAMIVAGAATVGLIHRFVPHEHSVKGREGPPSVDLRGPTLFSLAIALHNVPEGLSVGVASTADLQTGPPVLLGITTQNLPEGFAVAAALSAGGVSRGKAVVAGALTGVAEIAGGLMGIALVGLGEAVVPFAYAFAAGAMLFVISGEVIPETHTAGKESRATYALVLGFCAMMLLDVLF